MAKALDIGTSFIISASYKSNNEIEYKDVRDAFFRIKPTSPISASIIEKGLVNKSYFKDSDGSFVLIGQAAIEKAIERHSSASRPMVKGILSPQEKDARKILKFILADVLGPPKEKNEKLVYSIPAQPIDQEDFDVSYHEDVLNMDLKSLGYSPQALNEAEAVCYSELDKDEYTGVVVDFGAGMCNVAVMSNGEVVIKFSTCKSGDYIDHMAALSTGQPDSVVQIEKENGEFTIGLDNPNSILSAVSTYYTRVIDYTVKNLALRLSNSKDLPKFLKPISIVIAGGTSRANGFINQFKKSLSEVNFIVPVKEVRMASDPEFSIARGLLLAASL